MPGLSLSWARGYVFGSLGYAQARGMLALSGYLSDGRPAQAPAGTVTASGRGSRRKARAQPGRADYSGSVSLVRHCQAGRMISMI